MSRKPSVTKGVANSYASDGQTIVDFTDGESGGLISLHRFTDGPNKGLLHVEVYRTDDDVLVTVPTNNAVDRRAGGIDPRGLAEAILAGADRLQVDLRSTLDLSDEHFHALQRLAAGRQS